ncbi:MAG: glyoxalase/bleomycin resistance/extradiol dioxygenase family protein [Candidatus Micrarchaeota archaeon]|nr:glyoxalase/bleomycin resistance/extradiol dioxygenase family protein [Candidatus Micrarchaeota archaeon]
MATMIFVNLPVKDLKKTMTFFSKMGFKYNRQFTNKSAACMVISKEIFVMLLVKKFFKGFTKKQIVDSKKATEAIISLSAESRKKVDEMLGKAVKAGATEVMTQDHGWMYSCSFQDLDHHNWEIFWMDKSRVKSGG